MTRRTLYDRFERKSLTMMGDIFGSVNILYYLCSINPNNDSLAYNI